MSGPSTGDGLFPKFLLICKFIFICCYLIVVQSLLIGECCRKCLSACFREIG